MNRADVKNTNISHPEIERVVHSESYYEILEVKRDFRSEQILTKNSRKLAFKFHALMLHPDRSVRPGAEKAFRMIATAYGCLKDVEKRKVYDWYGPSAPSLLQMTQRFKTMDPEDILRFFFPDSFTEPKAVKKSNVLKLAAFVLPPLLLILGYYFFYDLRFREPDPFSLEKTPKFSVKRQHSTEDISFYVEQDFDRQTRGRKMYLQEVEDIVEGRFLQKLYAQCSIERKERRKIISEAVKVRGKDMVQSLRAAYENFENSCTSLDIFIDSKIKSPS